MGYDQKTNNIHDTANSIIYHVMRLLFAATVAAIQKIMPYSILFMEQQLVHFLCNTL